MLREHSFASLPSPGPRLALRTSPELRLTWCGPSVPSPRAASALVARRFATLRRLSHVVQRPSCHLVSSKQGPKVRAPACTRHRAGCTGGCSASLHLAWASPFVPASRDAVHLCRRACCRRACWAGGPSLLLVLAALAVGPSTRVLPLARPSARPTVASACGLGAAPATGQPFAAEVRPSCAPSCRSAAALRAAPKQGHPWESAAEGP